MKTSKNVKRWVVRSKKTDKVRSSYVSRAKARFAKLPSEYIFDTLNGVAVR